MIRYGAGWYPEERDDVAPYRWTKPEASFRVDLPAVPGPGPRYLRIVAGHGLVPREPLLLEVFAGGRSLGERRIDPGFSAYVFPLAEAGETEVRLRLNQALRVPGDPREFGLMVRAVEILTFPLIDTFLEGWYPPEPDGSRWMKPEAVCFFSAVPDPGPRYLRIVAGHGFAAAKPPLLEVIADGRSLGRREIGSAFLPYAFALADAGPQEIRFRVDTTFRGAEDLRPLGLRVRSVEVLTPPRIETYLEGWYPPEADGSRWMRPEAVCFLGAGAAAAPRYLRVVAGPGRKAERPPHLEVSVNGRSLGRRRIDPSFHPYAFPLDEAGDWEVRFRTEEAVRLPGDPDPRGLVVRSVEVLSPPGIDTFLEGWYPPEADGTRWMKSEARCFFAGLPEDETVYLRLVAGHPVPGVVPRLTVAAGGTPVAALAVPSGETDYWIPLGSGSPFRDLEFRVDAELETGDRRDERRLGLLVRSVDVLAPRPQAPLYAKGFLGWEAGDLVPFSWIGREASVYLSGAALKSGRFATFYACTEFANLTQTLSLSLNGRRFAELPLLYKWNVYSVPLPALAAGPGDPVELTLAVNRLFPARYHPEDKRELGVRVSRLEIHADEARHRDLAFFNENAVRNYREMQEGRTVLESYPTNLGVDIYAKCNIQPHCVYCLWDRMKVMEGERTNDVVDENTLRGYGPFFLAARTLVNCSFGEPLLHPRLAEILDLYDRAGKFVEISTNGQAFTARTVRALAGKRVTLYVSLDAATRETYAKLRNDRWDEVLSGLIRIGEARRAAGNLPKLFMVFMPMKVNRGEIEEYFRLCRRIEADALVLRPLLYLWNPQIREERGGYLFDYKDELLGREDLEEIVGRSEELSDRYGVPLANQLEFGTVQEPGSGKKKRAIREGKG
jgi:MoaA/NifB/PqqE/SkfB family radical SAM enzyme